MMPSGSIKRALTTTDWPEAGSTGLWDTSTIAGPALATSRELGRPGVPQLVRHVQTLRNFHPVAAEPEKNVRRAF